MKTFETRWKEVKNKYTLQNCIANMLPTSYSITTMSSEWWTLNKEQLTLFFPTSNYNSPFFPLLSLFLGPIPCTLSIRYGNGVCNNSEKEGYETWNFGKETCKTIFKWRQWDFKFWRRNMGWNLDNMMNGLKNGGLKCIALAKTRKFNGPFVVRWWWNFNQWQN